MFSIYLYPTRECFQFSLHYVSCNQVRGSSDILQTFLHLSYNFLIKFATSTQHFFTNTQIFSGKYKTTTSIIYLSSVVFFSMPSPKSTNLQFPIIHVTEAK